MTATNAPDYATRYNAAQAAAAPELTRRGFRMDPQAGGWYGNTPGGRPCVIGYGVDTAGLWGCEIYPSTAAAERGDVSGLMCPPCQYTDLAGVLAWVAATGL